MWHEDVASNDGYVAVCRFLFNCIIDHVMVTLQCCIFGCHSVSTLRLAALQSHQQLLKMLTMSNHVDFPL